ncbi:hypothetical protein [Antarctobacter sp.]|uniref:hypothetical protein n=1 Tax=Antarctobacter sp. TaxID=1872577 RepID=UPI003A918BDB
MDGDDMTYTATDMAALGDELVAASEEIRGLDCPGNIYADIPAMVLTDLAAMTVRQWTGEYRHMERSELLTVMCGALAYMFDWFKGEANDVELSRLRDLTRALDAMTREEHRPRFAKR